MQRKILIPALIMAAGVATAGGLAYAQQPGVTHNDAMANAAQARISLAQAVATAEQHTGGRANRAEIQNENGRLVYGVEVANGAMAMDIKVDAIDGSVVSAQADHVDHDSANRQEEPDND